LIYAALLLGSVFLVRMYVDFSFISLIVVTSCQEK